MTLDQINYAAQYGAMGLLVILVGCIKIPHLELNIWSWIGRIIGRAINGEIMDEVKEIEQKLDEHIYMGEKTRMRNIRQRILRFCDEILIGKKHTKEHFDEILFDIDCYEKFCLKHPDYKNNRANLAIKTIKDIYEQCIEHQSFLTYTQDLK